MYVYKRKQKETKEKTSRRPNGAFVKYTQDVEQIEEIEKKLFWQKFEKYVFDFIFNLAIKSIFHHIDLENEIEMKKYYLQRSKFPIKTIHKDT